MQLEGLENDTGRADFWDNPNQAQQVMQRLSKLRDEVNIWQETLEHIQDTYELAAMNDDSLKEELLAETERIAAAVEKLEFQAMFSGEYDREDAMLVVHAGSGGTDAQDWAAMLLRMYLRWAEAQGFKTEIVEETPGDEAGIKTASVAIQGAWAYGYLKAERGTHRLVRISPFDANSRRHTSFAGVEAWPDIQGDIEIEINDKDIEVDTFRSGGAGGQHMQKNDTAVRVTHLPTGVVVVCQNQRSQLQNLNRAMQVLKSRLLDFGKRKQEEEFAALKGEHISAEWGNQIRSYVLHPYQMVKDLRTQYETGRVNDVLDGDLNAFMESYLRYKVGVQQP